MGRGCGGFWRRVRRVLLLRVGRRVLLDSRGVFRLLRVRLGSGGRRMEWERGWSLVSRNCLLLRRVVQHWRMGLVRPLLLSRHPRTIPILCRHSIPMSSLSFNLMTAKPVSMNSIASPTVKTTDLLIPCPIAPILEIIIHSPQKLTPITTLPISVHLLNSTLPHTTTVLTHPVVVQTTTTHPATAQHPTPPVVHPTHPATAIPPQNVHPLTSVSPLVAHPTAKTQPTSSLPVTARRLVRGSLFVMLARRGLGGGIRIDRGVWRGRRRMMGRGMLRFGSLWRGMGGGGMLGLSGGSEVGYFGLDFF